MTEQGTNQPIDPSSAERFQAPDYLQADSMFAYHIVIHQDWLGTTSSKDGLARDILETSGRTATLGSYGESFQRVAQTDQPLGELLANKPDIKQLIEIIDEAFKQAMDDINNLIDNMLTIKIDSDGLTQFRDQTIRELEARLAALTIAARFSRLAALQVDTNEELGQVRFRGDIAKIISLISNKTDPR